MASTVNFTTSVDTAVTKFATIYYTGSIVIGRTNKNVWIKIYADTRHATKPSVGLSATLGFRPMGLARFPIKPHRCCMYVSVLFTNAHTNNSFRCIPVIIDIGQNKVLIETREVQYSSIKTLGWQAIFIESAHLYYQIMIELEELRNNTESGSVVWSKRYG